MRVDMLTREYPPHVYGGAGVHVAELSAVLREHVDLRVRCFDGPRDGVEGVTGYSVPSELSKANPAIQTFGVDLAMTSGASEADLVHSHTWYANLAGHMASLLGGIPHVLSAHSLEPLRPWKAEQLGGGYALSSWAERTAYEHAAKVIAVSHGMRRDILRAYPQIDPEKVTVVHNGIDLDSWKKPTEAEIAEVCAQHGVDPSARSVIFVGRITRQKGLPYLLAAARKLPADVQLILCAGAPDTKELAAEVTATVDELRRSRSSVVWIQEMLPRPQVAALLAAATTFVCPSIYEPLGIVNLEAMAVETAVVASGTGGIPEVVADGETGMIVPLEQVDDGTGRPLDPEKYIADLAGAMTEMVDDPARAERFGKAGHQRAADHFAWSAIGERTLEVYRDVLAGRA